jgi:hypothetical protein
MKTRPFTSEIYRKREESRSNPHTDTGAGTSTVTLAVESKKVL